MFNMASGRVEDQAFVTLATNDQYCYGALVLGQSLRDNGTSRQLAILVTPHVSQQMRQQLSLVYDVIRQVDPLDSHDEAHLALLTRPELGITFSKLHCWRLTQYNKCVFMDADTLVLHNVDELFNREEFSAAPDVGWPDCFNSGVFVFKPSEETYQSLLQCAVTQGSFDGGDQGLLNTFFSGWATEDINKHLPFIYNMTSNISYTYKPALLRFGQDIKIVHFIGNAKPWRYTYNTLTGTVSAPEGIGYGGGHGLDYVQSWWNIFMTSIKPRIEAAQAKQEFVSAFPQSLFAAQTTLSNLSNRPSSFVIETIMAKLNQSSPPTGTVSAKPNQSSPTTGMISAKPNQSSSPTGTISAKPNQLSSLTGTNLSTKPSPPTFLPITHTPQVPPTTAATSPSLTTGVGLASEIGNLKLSDGAPGLVRSPGSPRSRQHAWEQGEVDYMGQDKFDNIQKHIQDKINDK